ncbi:zinc finger protein Elbow-like [Chelonus insularis]|uniref:zinc finger protein Elbow-like n=1 Tax=Chelonus insularis TaxID=460826 RepID=UPI001588FB45|nr:zinc finger protein Elbow-like [Chelonus insularis]
MLMSNANQYLRPEYLTPLPTTLDAKKSPLALLAQTCSQIGADTSSKPLLTSLDKSNLNKPSKTGEKFESKDKSSPHANINASETVKSSFKPYESCVTRDKTSSPEEPVRAPSSQSTSGRSRTPGNSSKRCSSNQSASSARATTPQGRKTATPNGNEQTRESPASRTSSSDISSSQIYQVPRSDSSPYLKPTFSPSLTITDPSIKDFPLGTFKPGSSVSSSIPTAAAVSSAYLSYPPQLPIDVMASSLVSQHHATLKNGLGNSFLSYARVKNSSGTESLVPVCRDPYCTGCQLNSHLLAASSTATTTTASTNSKLVNTTTSVGIGNVNNPNPSCLAGCVQCDHKPVTNLYGSVGSAAHVNAMAAYAHAQLAALAAASQLPYICNWIAGDTSYCGKRFSTSEELLQHLRSHTSVSSDPSINTAAALSFFNPTAAGLPPNHPLFSRTYPTPPLSPLATARYHPYGKASPLLPPSLSSLGLTIPPTPPHPVAVAASLPPYLSPYSLYSTGPRLGATSSLHH